MIPDVNLVVFGSERPWPSLHALIHFHRQRGGVRRLFIYQAADDRGPKASAERLARFVREQFPEIRVERREGEATPRAVRAQLDAWRRTDAEAGWVLNLPDGLTPFEWGATDWIGSEATQVVYRNPVGEWLALGRDPDGSFSVSPLPEMRRQETDTLPIVPLVSALIPEPGPGLDFRGEEARVLPVVRLTEAAIARQWRWREAFVAEGLDPGGDTADILFERFVGALLLCSGLSNVVHGRLQTDPKGGSRTQLWVNHGGRLAVLDVKRVPDGPEDADGQEAVWMQIQDAAEDRRLLGEAAADWILIRPCHRFSAIESALAAAHRIRFLDQAACPELPTHLARLFDLPVPAEGAEVERVLRHHLAHTGAKRVFGADPVVLSEQRAAGTDPVVLNTNGWLDNVRRERGQNWLLWSHGSRLVARFPTESRADALSDWTHLVAAVARLDRQDLEAQTLADSVAVSAPNDPEIRNRLSAWLRPFLNAPLSFRAAQERMAAEARIHAAPTEEAPAERPPPRRPTHPATPSPPGKQRPAAPRPTVTPRHYELGDLDQALDAALRKAGGEKQ